MAAIVRLRAGRGLASRLDIVLPLAGAARAVSNTAAVSAEPNVTTSAQAAPTAATGAAKAATGGGKEDGGGGGSGIGIGGLAAAVAAAAGGYWAYSSLSPSEGDAEGDDSTQLVNWSGTHQVSPQRFHQPESLPELEALVEGANTERRRLRTVGSALSPNGLSFCEDGMLSMALMDKVLWVDEASKQVRVQAGARVQDVVEALRPHGLTLQNYASIREQQIGGFTQVGAHGTGAAIPPVDEQVVSMKLVTPGQGTLELSEGTNPALFRLARCGLGALGVVAEVTLQCVPAHRLLESTWVSNMAEIKKNHAKWLKENQHIRYMWIPFTDTVVVVANNPVPKPGWLPGFLTRGPKAPPPSTVTEEERLAEMRALLMEATGVELADIEEQTAFQLRDALIAHDPLDPAWIRRVNKAEAEFWKRSAGVREGWSDELLGFDCGGQQWVLEVAFPTGTLERPTMADLAYMEQLLKQIESSDIPAPAPIEQRWTSASASPMSPAFSADPKSVFSWVGVIMYLPTDDAQQRAAITSRFHEYTRMLYTYLVPQYRAVEHWAKIEVPGDVEGREAFQNRLKARYPVAEFNAARRLLDPHNVMANSIIDALFPLGSSA